MKYSDKLIQALFKGIYNGKVKPRALPSSLYFAIADYLKKGVYKGYGTSLSSLKATKMPSGFSNVDKLLLTELRTNIYLFSAAKTYQQVREMSNALIGDDGKIVSFKQFREKADQTYSLYNKTWLQTEYNTAIGQAQVAQKWVEIEKNADLFPLLEYSAVLDKRTSDICKPLDGIVAPVGDPIWKRVAPLNHFNCRCLLLPISEGKQTSEKSKKSRVDETENQMDDLFKMNPGQDKYIFSKKHPYFDVAPKDKGLAKKNFNLKIPKND
jgi:SPP1 gp7 family putative phage head morphogenesis protein